MKDLEKAIEKASTEYVKTRYKRDDVDRESKFGFIAGAKSPEAKAFHQQGVYSESEVEEICRKAQIKYAFTSSSNQPYNESEFEYEFEIWFNQNKKK